MQSNRGGRAAPRGGGLAAVSLLAFAGLACYTMLAVWGRQQGAAARAEASCARGDPLYPAVRRPGLVPPFFASGDQSACCRLLWQGWALMAPGDPGGRGAAPACPAGPTSARGVPRARNSTLARRSRPSPAAAPSSYREQQIGGSGGSLEPPGPLS